MRSTTVILMLVAVAYCDTKTAVVKQAPNFIPCSWNENCPDDRACILNRCVDPCVGVCGRNAVCFAMRHTVTNCACQLGYTGDPFKQCTWAGGDRGREPLFTRKPYYISKEKKTWPDAIAGCYSRGMTMVSILQLKDQVSLEEAMEKSGLKNESVWLGLIWARHIRKQDTVIWTSRGISGNLDTGLPFTYYSKCKKSWGYCYSTSATDKWCETSCEELHYYACEYAGR